jgi:hypothetical protein
MYDHLEDPDTPVPGDGALSAVNARAKALRLRRSALVGGSAGSFVLVAALVLSNLGGGETKASLVVVSTPTPSVVQTGTPQPEPVPTLAPSVTPTKAPPRLSTSPPRPTPSPTIYCPYGPGTLDCSDGKPGWAGGFTSCEVPTSVAPGPQSKELIAGLTASLVPPSGLASGGQGRITLRFHNGGASTVGVNVNDSNVVNVPLVGPGGGSQLQSTDARGYGVGFHDIAPGADFSLSYPVLASTCGDSSRDPNPPLPSGTYTAGISVIWSGRVNDPTPTGSPTASAGPSPTPAPATSSGPLVLNAPVHVS